MKLSVTFQSRAQVSFFCGLGLILALVAGCGPKAAPPASPAAAKPKAEVTTTNAAVVVAGNPADQYSSVFEELLPPRGRDPFYPYSHRRDVKVEVPPDPNAHAAPVLVLKAIIRTSKHSQAVINNVILEAGEEQTVRVPDGKAKVRCIEIGKNYVVVQVEGEAEPKRLMMDQKKY